MKKLIAALAVVVQLSGCSTVIGWIPSFSDGNQSSKITDIRTRIELIDCSQAQLPQALAIRTDIMWFNLYSESKGSRQQDVVRLVEPMKETVDDWVKRSQDNQGSVAYCEIKKKLLQRQASTAASAILGRF